MKLRTSITDRITDCDDEAVLELSVVDTLARDLETFVTSASDKFIKGQKEHGGSIQDRDLDHEITNEIIDLFHYHQANKRKRAELERRVHIYEQALSSIAEYEPFKNNSTMLGRIIELAEQALSDARPQ